MLRRRVELAVLCAFGVACSHRAPAGHASESRDGAAALQASPTASEDASIVAPSIADPRDASSDAAALAGHPARVDLVDGDEKLGVVAVPLGAREARPIVVALHGGSEKPERACEAWQVIVERYAFVVCPRGWGGNERRLGWRSPVDTSQRVARAIAETKRKFGGWVRETSSVVLAGFSMGGVQVARLAYREPSRYRRIVVGDSAHDPRPALTFAHAWATSGGERALFLCTTSGCEPSHRAAAKRVASEKKLARLNVAPTQKHGLSEPVIQSMRRDWAWLVDGVEGWEAYVPPDESSLPGRTESFDGGP